MISPEGEKILILTRCPPSSRDPRRPSKSVGSVPLLSSLSPSTTKVEKELASRIASFFVLLTSSSSKRGAR